MPAGASLTAAVAAPVKLAASAFSSSGTRKALHALLGTATVAIIVLGSLVIFTFDPCLGTDPSLVPDFCKDLA